MRAPVGPAQLPRLDLKAPPGWYPIDNFLACFEPVRGSERPLSSDDKPTFDELEPGPELELFRWDVDRLVRLALLRTERDDTDLPEARREAAGLLAQLIEIRPALGDLVARTTGDAAVMAAKLSPALRRKRLHVPEGVDRPDPQTAISYIVEINEQARNLREWVDRFLDEFKPVALAHNLKPLPRHLARLAVTLHHQRLGKWPAASRRHWLSEFLGVVVRQFQLPMPHKGDEAKLADYLGGKVEEAVHEQRSQS
jgi:hypothetical protein